MLWKNGLKIILITIIKPGDGFFVLSPAIFFKRKSRPDDKYMVGGDWMRKLFLSAAIVLLFAGARVKARTIITEAGALSDELLPEDGCGIVDGAVDWNKPGRYPVMFEDGEAGEVIVASGDEFSGGFDIEKVYNRINLEESFDFLMFCSRRRTSIIFTGLSDATIFPIARYIAKGSCTWHITAKTA